MESGLPSKTFSGVRFALVGFNPTDGNTVIPRSPPMGFQFKCFWSILLSKSHFFSETILDFFDSLIHFTTDTIQAYEWWWCWCWPVQSRVYSPHCGQACLCKSLSSLLTILCCWQSPNLFWGIYLIRMIRFVLLLEAVGTWLSLVRGFITASTLECLLMHIRSVSLCVCLVLKTRKFQLLKGVSYILLHNLAGSV